MIRVFPRRTKWTPDDNLAFVGDPPIIGRPPEQPVMVSCAFTWDINECERLSRSWSRYYQNVQIGGPGLGDPGGIFEPGIFIKEGVTITSRGCPKSCPWCFVHPREGEIRELPIRPGYIIQDNNLLACSYNHVRRVFEMLKKQGKAASFHGGLDAEFFTEKHLELLDTITVTEMWFACDHIGAIEFLKPVSEMLSNYSRNKKRCFVLVGFDGETIRQAEKRLLAVWDMGFLPFAMPFRSEKLKKEFYGKDWSALIKTFSRPAATKAEMKKRAAWVSNDTTNEPKRRNHEIFF